MTVRDYDDVPGTYVLDSRTYRKGYHLNMMLMSLNAADSRAKFAKDEAGYLADYQLTDAQRDAVLERRYLDMLKPVSYTHLTLPTIYSV